MKLDMRSHSTLTHAPAHGPPAGVAPQARRFKAGAGVGVREEAEEAEATPKLAEVHCFRLLPASCFQQCLMFEPMSDMSRANRPASIRIHQ